MKKINRMRSEGGLTTKDSMDWTEQQGNAQKKCSLYNPLPPRIFLILLDPFACTPNTQFFVR